jgi:neutral/alkaline ceramidase-like enzyme
MLQAGTAKISILPKQDLHLIGVYSRKPRIGEHQRDPLVARALALSQNEISAVIISADLLCVSEELHQALVKALPELGPDSIFLAGTHTHSSFGGFFHSSATKEMLGAPNKEVFDFLVDKLAQLAKQALSDLAAAHASTGSGKVRGLVSSRRQANGPHDDRLVLLRLERKDRKPIDLICVSGHPVIVVEKETNTISGDYPGEFCRSLETQGSQPVFLSAGLGGASILFPEFEMDLERHMSLAVGLLSEGYRQALASCKPVALGDSNTLSVDFVHLSHAPHQCRFFSGLGAAGKFADALVSPLRNSLTKKMSRALPLKNGIPLHFIKLGDFLVLGSANELGISIVLAIREIARKQSLPIPMVASLVDGYAGYIHLSHIYKLWPEKGYRFLAFYENGLAMFGYDLGDQIVRAAETWMKKNMSV